MKNRCECDFCNEIQKNDHSLFSHIYKGVGDRIVGEDELFVVMPTIGQLFPYSLLILPKKHIETMAELGETELDRLEQLIGKVRGRLSPYGEVISFEHGAKKETGGSCGIYHAHIHIMPVPTEIDLTRFYYSREKISCHVSLKECYCSLNGVRQYFMNINADGSVYSADITTAEPKYPSQFFRKMLSEHYGVDKSWDWRTYDYMEVKLLDTLKEISI